MTEGVVSHLEEILQIGRQLSLEKVGLQYDVPNRQTRQSSLALSLVRTVPVQGKLIRARVVIDMTGLGLGVLGHVGMLHVLSVVL